MQQTSKVEGFGYLKAQVCLRKPGQYHFSFEPGAQQRETSYGSGTSDPWPTLGMLGRRRPHNLPCAQISLS
jgi:hypothetical protein